MLCRDHSLEQTLLIIENLKVFQGSKFQTKPAMSQIRVGFRRTKFLTAQKGSRMRNRSHRCARIVRMSRKCMKSSWEVLSITILQPNNNNRNRKCMTEAMALAVSYNLTMEVTNSRSLIKQHSFTTLQSTSKSAIGALSETKTGSQLVKHTNRALSSATQVKLVIQLEKTALRCTKMSITWHGKPKSTITCNARRSLSEVNSKRHSTMIMQQM